MSQKLRDAAEARRQSRRRFFQTAGVTITLPLLPSLMWQRRAGAQDACGTPQRFLAYMYANGNHKPDYLPPGSDGAAFNVAGDAWQLPAALSTWQDLKADIVYCSGLENQERRREFGDHAIGCGALLTARMPTKDLPRSNMSVDQAIADKLQECHSGIHSLQLGTHNLGFYDVFGTFIRRTFLGGGKPSKTQMEP